MPRRLAGSPLLLLLAACSDLPDPGATDGGDSETAPATTGDPGTTGGPTSAAPTTDPPDPSATSSDVTTAPDPTTTGGATTDVDPATTSTTTSTTTTGDTTTGGATTDPPDTTGTTGGVDPLVPELPVPTGACPDIDDGIIAFHPAGLDSPRDVRIWVDLDTAAQADGPVVFYWYGTNGEPDQALTGVGDLAIQEVLDLGGIVIAPTHDPMAGLFPWWLVLSENLDDLVLADEVLACAREQIGVDASQIWSLGFSAGALHTAQMSVRRSSYIAAVATYSGGLLPGGMPPFEDPDNKFSAMIFHGGPTDVVVVGFEQASEDYAAYLDDNGNFNFLCDHGDGHNIPPVQDSVFQFLFDHPYGQTPSPYMQGLPGDFPPYCVL